MANNEATLLIRIKKVGDEILDRLVITVGDVVNAIGKIPEAVMAAVNAYREEELAVNQLNTSMINSGVYTAELSQQYLEMASALQQSTTFADDQIIAAQALLQSHIGNIRITKELMTATLDLAAAKGIDLKTAADLVGKTIGTETNALARQGIQLTETSDKTERLAQVITGINGKWSGQAETMAKGLGVMDQVKNSWSDFLENSGKALAPFVASLAGATKSVLDFLNSMMTGGFDESKANVDQLSAEILKLRQRIIDIQETAKDRKMEILPADQATINALEKTITSYKEARDKILENERAAREQAAQEEEADAQAKREKRLAQTETDLMDMVVAQTIKNDTELQMRVDHLNKIIASEQDAVTRLKALKEKQAIEDKIREQNKVKSQAEIDKIKVQGQKETLDTIATLQSSSNKTLAAAGKAAAITNIAIATPSAVAKAYDSVPYPMNFVAAGLVAAAMAAQASKIAGVQLAEGGIVKATPGGIQATIGEGGRDEAVIPLEDGQIPGSKQGNTFIFNGPVMGDENQAMEFAKAIDRNLLRLRQSNQAVAFDADLI